MKLTEHLYRTEEAIVKSEPPPSDLATKRERNLTTEKRAERTKLDFRCRIWRSAIGHTSCLI